jgi:hypothetical protein
MEVDGELKQLNGSLADRLRALQQQQQNWRQRLNKSPEPSTSIASRAAKLLSIDSKGASIRLRERPKSICVDSSMSSSANCSINSRLADRLSLLQESSRAWVNRVEDKDVKRFTVAGKLEINKSKQTGLSDTFGLDGSHRSISQVSDKQSRKSFANLEPLNESIVMRQRSPSEKENVESKQKRIRPMSELISQAWEVDQAKNRRSWAAPKSINKIESSISSSHRSPIDDHKSESSRMNRSIDSESLSNQKNNRLTQSSDQMHQKSGNDNDIDLDGTFDKLPMNRQNLLVIRKNIPTQNRRAASKRFVKSLAETGSTDSFERVKVSNGSRSPSMTNQSTLAHTLKSSSNDQATLSPAIKDSPNTDRARFSALESSLDSPPSIRSRPNESLLTNNRKTLKDVHSGLAESARAGLASTEDFKSVASRLRKATVNTGQHLDNSDLRKQPLVAGLRSTGSARTSQSSDGNHESNTDELIKPILLQVKGRRFTQIRVVAAEPESMNHGDCFVLILRDTVFVWLGEFGNVIERAKAIELGERLHDKRELGHRGGRLLCIDLQTSEGVSASTLSAFASALNVGGGLVQLDARIQPAGDADEDELYERVARQHDQVFAVDLDDEHLRLENKMSGKALSQRWLHADRAFVFDMTDEVYVWLGSQLSAAHRNVALRLARQQFSQQTRPSHALFHKCNQHMELQLFREKFVDWSEVRVPDLGAMLAATGCIGGGSAPSLAAGNSTPSIDSRRLQLTVNFDAKSMLDPAPEADLLLEDTHLGRGDSYHDASELLHSQIVTQQICCWHVNESERREVPVDERFGQFFDSETYVLRWQYAVSRVGRELDLAKRYPFARPAAEALPSTKSANTEASSSTDRKRTATGSSAPSSTGSEQRPAVTGRERCCYFYWQGTNCSVNSRGAAALLAVELDKEKSPQVQIDQGRELPAFLRLFAGRLVVYHSEPGEAMPHSERALSNALRPLRLYLVRGVVAEEATLVEVSRNVRSLRSRGCFVVLDANREHALLWKGSLTNRQQQSVARHAFQSAIDSHRFYELCHRSLRLTGSECDEGDEPSSFWSFFDRTVTISDQPNFRRSYFSALLQPTIQRPSNEMRLFRLSSVSGGFQFERVLCTYSKSDSINGFPFEQSHLYSVSQPAFFLLDSGPTVYLWQGWFPELVGSLVTGSSKVRYSQEKKCALETVISYTHRTFAVPFN